MWKKKQYIIEVQSNVKIDKDYTPWTYKVSKEVYNSLKNKRVVEKGIVKLK